MNREAEERVLREMGAVIASDAAELAERIPEVDRVRRPRGAGALSVPGATTVP
jgi:hypothetical protein